MKTTDIIRRAGRNLRQSKMRTFLTAMAISVGAFTLTLSLAAGQGSRDYASKLIQSNVDPQSLFIVKDKSLFEGSGTTDALQEKSSDMTSADGRGSYKALTTQDIEKLKNLSNITDVEPVYQLTVDSLTFSTNDKKQYSGSVSTYNPDVIGESAAGAMPKRGSNLPSDQAIVPNGFASALGVEPRDLIGKTVTLNLTQPTQSVDQEKIQQAFMHGGSDAVSQLVKGATKSVTLTIVAVAKQSATSFSDSNAMQISSQTAQSINEFTTKGTGQQGKYFAVTAKAKADIEPEAAKTQLEKAGYAAKTAKDLQGLLFTIVNILQGIVTGFGILALIASVFGIVNTQYISVLERTGQIGLMKALGMSQRSIGKLFRYEAAWVGFLGGVVGAGAAIVVGALANPIITDKLSLGEGTILLKFVWWQVALLIVLLVVIAILAGWFPSRKAARLDPIEALRTE